MKILHFLYRLNSGGAERFVVDLANRQVAEGHEVGVCIIRPDEGSSGFNRRFLDGRVRFTSLGISSGITPAKMTSVKRFILSEAPDVLHCHHNVVPYLLLLLLSGKRPTIVHTLHSMADRATVNQLEKRLCKWAYKNGLICPVTISEVCRQSFLREYGINAVCIPNGREAMTPSVRAGEVKAEVELLKASPKTKIFIHIARFHPIKNQAMLVEAFNRLYNDGKDLMLLVIGDGFKDGPGAELVGRACPCIHFLGEKYNVQDYLYAADAFCLTSLSEGMSISLIEAMCCGVTPVCTPVGGNVDVIQDGVTGYLSENTSLESYMEAINRFFGHSIDRVRLQEYYRDNFSIESCACKYSSLYEGIAHNN